MATPEKNLPITVLESLGWESSEKGVYRNRAQTGASFFSTEGVRASTVDGLPGTTIVLAKGAGGMDASRYNAFHNAVQDRLRGDPTGQGFAKKSRGRNPKLLPTGH